MLALLSVLQCGQAFTPTMLAATGRSHTTMSLSGQSRGGALALRSSPLSHARRGQYVVVGAKTKERSATAEKTTSLPETIKVKTRCKRCCSSSFVLPILSLFPLHVQLSADSDNGNTPSPFLPLVPGLFQELVAGSLMLFLSAVNGFFARVFAFVATLLGKRASQFIPGALRMMHRDVFIRSWTGGGVWYGGKERNNGKREEGRERDRKREARHWRSGAESGREHERDSGRVRGRVCCAELWCGTQAEQRRTRR